jgi:hypothetical protein
MKDRVIKMQMGKMISIINQNCTDGEKIINDLKKDNNEDYLNALKAYVSDNNLKGKRKTKKEKTTKEVVKILTNDDRIKTIIASGATEVEMISQIREIYSKEERRKEITDKIKNLNEKKIKIEEEIKNLTEQLNTL